MPNNDITNETNSMADLMSAVAKVEEGMAAKNATMKDGPPEGGDKDGAKQGTKTASEQYQEDVAKIHDAGLEGGDAALAHAQALQKYAEKTGVVGKSLNFLKDLVIGLKGKK